MSMCMRVAVRHIYHHYVSIIINIITSSSSSLSSTSYLCIVAPIGITEQCYRTLLISDLVLRAAAWVWKESTQGHFFEHFAPLTAVPIITVFAPSFSVLDQIRWVVRTFVLYISITNLYCLSTVCDMLGGLFTSWTWSGIRKSNVCLRVLRKSRI